MKPNLLRVLALAPIPVIIALVVWAGRRPLPPPPVLEGSGAHGLGAHKTLELPTRLKPDWTVQGKIERYDQKTLFDRIDGAAPAYIRAGFQYSLGAELRKPAMKESVVADIYAMGSATRALGMYATERDPSYRFIKVGDAGYLASGSLNFWRGAFYVKLAGYDEGEAMDGALTELAGALSTALPGLSKQDGTELAPLGWLPQQGRVPNLDGYSHPPLGDVEGLAGAFYASYKGEGDTTYRLFVVSGKDASDAGARYDQVKAYFARDNAKVAESTEATTGVMVVQGDSTSTLVLHRGSVLAGGIDLPAPSLVPLARTQLQPTLERTPTGVLHSPLQTGSSGPRTAAPPEKKAQNP